MRPRDLVLLFCAPVWALLTSGCDPRQKEGAPPKIEIPAEPVQVLQSIRIGVVRDIGAAPIVVAHTRGLFEKHGLSASLRVLDSTGEVLRLLAAGELEAGMVHPAEALLPRETDDYTISIVLARNAGAISVSPSLWERMQGHLPRLAGGEAVHPIHADALRLLAQEADLEQKPIRFQTPSPLSTDTLTLGYWLAAGGIRPEDAARGGTPAPHPYLRHARVLLSEQPDPDGADGRTGSLWRRPKDDIVVVSSEAVVNHLPSFVLSSLAEWNEANRETLVSCVAALLEAGQWLDESMENRGAAVAELVSSLGEGNPEPSGGSPLNIDLTSGTGVSFTDNGSATPDWPSSLWILSQLVRWGHLPSTTTNDAYESLVAQTLVQDIFIDAVEKTGAYLPGLRLRLDRDTTIEQVIDGNRLLPGETAAYVNGFKIRLP